jgi:hypothetical protein
MRSFNGYHLLAGVLAGLGTGALCGYLAAHRRYERDLTREVIALKDHYRAHIQAADAGSDHAPGRDPSSVGEPRVGTPAKPGERKPGDKPPLGKLAGGIGFVPSLESLGGPGDPLEGIPPDEPGEEPEDGDPVREGDEDEGGGWPPADRDLTSPYIISIAEFCEDNDSYNKITVTWYAADSVLVDDKEVPVRDHAPIVGLSFHRHFGEQSNDPHIVYVRNDRLEGDFEIILNEGSYAESIGYGKPK